MAETNGGSQKREAPQRRYEPSLLRLPFVGDPVSEAREAELQQQLAKTLEDTYSPQRVSGFQTAVDPKRLRELHESLFRTIASDPEQVGRFRHPGETSAYVVWTRTSKEGSLVERHLAGWTPHPKHGMNQAVAKTFDGFNRATPGRPFQAIPTENAVRLSGQLLIAVLRIRPFVDGNDFVAHLVMQAAYYRLGLPPLSVTHLAFSDDGLRFNNAVADALQQGRFRSEEPLVEFLLELQTR